jgi:hypothetical protein
VKTLRFLTITYCLLTLLACCKKEEDPKPKPSYTIQGKIYQAYPTIPYVRQAITITVTRGGNIGGFKDTYVSKDLATATTNDSGWFSVSYPATDITGSDPGGNAQIHIYSQFFQFDGLPVNQNVNKDFYIPTKGKIKISLQTNNPLETNNDTLYFAYLIQDKTGTSLEIDTLQQTFTGLYKTLILPVGYENFFWSRGKNNFKYDSARQGFTKIQHDQGLHIDGDPIVNEITINY